MQTYMSYMHLAKLRYCLMEPYESIVAFSFDLLLLSDLSAILFVMLKAATISVIIMVPYFLVTKLRILDTIMIFRQMGI